MAKWLKGKNKKKQQVQSDTMIHLSTTYRRESVGVAAEPKKEYSWVLKGMLISTMVLSGLLSHAPTHAQANANPNPVGDTSAKITSFQQQESVYSETSMLSNLKMATRVVESAINLGEFNQDMFISVMQKVTAITTYISMEDGFKDEVRLQEVVSYTSGVLEQTNVVQDKDIQKSRDASIDSVNQLRNYLGLDDLVLANVPPTQAEIQPASTFSTPQLKAATTQVASANINYKDYKSGQWWSDDILWALETGVMKGFVNAQHPTNPKLGYGNWLNPDGKLSESQMLTMILRYSKPNDVANAQKTTSWWAEPTYAVAKKFNIPAKGSIQNQKAGDVTATRSELAVALATLHAGKKVTETEAIQFMFTAGITNGVDPSKGITIANFGGKNQLTRAQMVSFTKRYHDYVTTGTTDILQKPPAQVTPTPPPPPTQVTPPATSGEVVRGIKVLYGKHTYGSANQAEYDKVMAIVNQGIANERYDLKNGTFGKMTQEVVQAYMSGERGNGNRNDPAANTPRNIGLVQFGATYGQYLDAGISLDAIYEFQNALTVAKNLLAGARDPLDGSPSSAYDALVRRVSDCDSNSNVYNAVFDTKGYNTMIIGAPNHTTAFVQIEGKWINLDSGKIDNDITNLGPSVYIHTAPTFGNLK